MAVFPPSSAWSASIPHPLRYIAALVRSPGYQLAKSYHRRHKLVCFLIPGAIAILWISTAWRISNSYEHGLYFDNHGFFLRFPAYAGTLLGSTMAGAMMLEPERRQLTLPQLLLTPISRGRLIAARSLFMFRPFALSLLLMVGIDAVFAARARPTMATCFLLRCTALSLLVCACSLGAHVLGIYISLTNRNATWALARAGFIGSLWSLAICLVGWEVLEAEMDDALTLLLPLLSFPFVLFSAAGGLAKCVKRFDQLILCEPDDEVGLRSITHRECRSVKERRTGKWSGAVGAQTHE